MRWVTIIGLGAVVVTALTIVGVVFYRPRIEADLLSKTTVALAKKNIPAERIDFSGRDGRIRVSNPAAASDAKRTAEAVFGVRRADALGQPELEIRKPDVAAQPIVQEPQLQQPAVPIAPEEPSLLAERIGPKLRLSGLLPPTGVLQRLEEGAAKVFGVENLDRRWQEQKSVRDAAYLPQLVRYFELLGQVGPEAKLSLEGKVLTLEGEVPDEASKVTLVTVCKARLPAGLSFSDRLTVPERTTLALVSEIAEALDAIRLNFKFDSTQLTAETRANLKLLKQTLADNPGPKLRIVGHTDWVGTDWYNNRLSRQRAKSIRQRILGWGFPKNRFEIEGHGKREPVADNRTPEGRQLNRRVVLAVKGDR